MRVMILIKGNKESEQGVMPDEEFVRKMMNFNEELMRAGVLLEADGLHPSSKGARVRFSRGKTTVIDGPFAETKELIAGYWIWNVKSVQEAVEWVKRCPSPDNIDDTQEGEIEIRPIFEASDFVSDFAPDIKNQTDRMRDHIEKQKTS